MRKLEPTRNEKYLCVGTTEIAALDVQLVKSARDMEPSSHSGHHIGCSQATLLIHWANTKNPMGRRDFTSIF